jgi:hypothetical protein
LLGLTAGVIVLAATARPAAAAPRCEIGDAVEGQEIHCFLKAKDGLQQTIAVNSAFPTEVLFELTQWIGPCGKPATRQTNATKAFRGENKALLVLVKFRTAAECAEVAFTECQAAEATASPGQYQMKRFDCPAALEITP